MRRGSTSTAGGGSGPAGGLRLDAGGGPGRGELGGHVAGGAARAVEAVAAGAPTSVGRPPDPAGDAADEAGVPGAKNLRSAGLKALGGLRAVPFGTDPERSPVGAPPFWVNPLPVLDLG